MRMMGLRETGNGIGTFDMNVFNREAADSSAYDQAADTVGRLHILLRFDGIQMESE